MSTYKEMFANYTSEALLQKRALGDELADEAHRAIEEIFADRGEQLPPRPTMPIFIAEPGKPISKVSGAAWSVFWIAVVLTTVGASKALAHTWIGIVAALCVLAYLVVNWVRKQSQSPEERMEEAVASQAAREGLTELMVLASNGDLVRIKELVAFGTSVNTQSPAGTTALMYAARNNHLEVARFLLSAGAGAHVTSKNGSSAVSIAKKFGHGELAAILERHGASKQDAPRITQPGMPMASGVAQTSRRHGDSGVS